MIPIEKNVIVLDSEGNQIGSTYPKRAKGLIKNGRAIEVSDAVISLTTQGPPYIMEDIKMKNRLYFVAREWNFNKACTKNVGERCFINGIDGELVEAYSIGNWQWDHTEIISKPMVLEKNQSYHFSFWLNGGENDRNDEICQFRVVFDGDHDNALTYKLNRGFIKPLKRYCGWELYDLSFNSGDNDITQLKFVSRSAYTAIQPAKDPEEYANLEEVLDEFHEWRPQRHNMIFEDGWPPANNWYSTKELRKKREKEERGEKTEEAPFNFNFHEFGKNMKGKFTDNPLNFEFLDKFKNMKRSSHTHQEKTVDQEFKVHEDKQDDDVVDLKKVMDEIKEKIDVDSIMKDIIESFDMEALREEIKLEVLNHLKKES